MYTWQPADGSRSCVHSSVALTHRPRFLLALEPLAGSEQQGLVLRGHAHPEGTGGEFISLKVSSKSFCRSQPPPKYVNLFFSITNIKNKLTNLCGN